MTLNKIIDDRHSYNLEDGKLFNFSKESASAKFYAELFSENVIREKKQPELYEEVKNNPQNAIAYKKMESIMKFLEQQLKKDDIIVEIGGGVDQNRSGNAYKRFENYFPLDISYSSIKRYTQLFDKQAIVCDATELPFRDNSIDCIFTHTFLEHPLNPQAVLQEISRVLKPNGIVVHNDAWFCRWWHRYGLVGLKKYKNMDRKEKLISILAKITEIKILRYPPIILKRAISNVFGGKKNIRLKYKKLQPNYTLHLGCDEDAASSIDPVDVIRFYESRNFITPTKLSFFKKLFFPHTFIILKKLP